MKVLHLSNGVFDHDPLLGEASIFVFCCSVSSGVELAVDVPDFLWGRKIFRE
jgi:hypothetical protein